jgi:hypothetical protein
VDVLQEVPDVGPAELDADLALGLQQGDDAGTVRGVDGEADMILGVAMHSTAARRLR